MNFQIKGDSDCPLAEIILNENENVNIERGSMVYTSNVSIQGKLNTGKKGISGIFGAIGRSFASGESMFITNATGMTENSVIGISPKIPGKIKLLKVSENIQYRLNTGAFLACDESVLYIIKSQNIEKALLGGTGGLFVMETTGEGDLLVSAFGDIIEIDVTAERPYTIDNEHVIAWDKNLDYKIEIASGTFGFTTGEGIVNKFYGNGKVYIQTRNLNGLANAVSPYIPSSK